MDHNVGAVFERTQEVRRGKGAVDNQRQAVVVRDFPDGFDVGDVERRVTDGLGVERFRFVGDRRRKVLRVGRVDKFYGDAELRQDVVELRVASAVEVARRDNLIARLCEVDDAVEDRSGSGGDGQCAGSAFERGDALFENVGGGVHEACVDVAELFESKEIGGVLGVFKDVRAGSIDRNGAAACGGFRCVARVKRQCFCFVAHDFPSFHSSY